MAAPPTSPTPRNRLAGETSPYLLQHAGNPVDWHPWGTEALDLARTLDRPILLSIGYSACHWCHVMAHESFEDAATAERMNALYVNIKVDREERPDLDRIYQVAHQMLTQRGGGWPLTMFLSPRDQRPFFGGTYFPPVARYGMPAFRDILERVAVYFREHGDDIRRQGDALLDVFGQLLPAPSRGPLDRGPLELARATLEREFDPENGGFGPAPRFPNPTNLELLLRAWRASANGDRPDLQALYMATLTLTRMSEGGLYDQLGGGFARYSVDEHWMIPHFEKMLYDNAQLLDVAAQASIATGEPLFRRVAAETADWMRRDLGHDAGGFYSTLDADSEGHEGRFYAWDREDVRAQLTSDEYGVFAPRFGLDREPNFARSWHLHAVVPIAELATRTGRSEDEVVATIDRARRTLLLARNRRVWPGLDEKILTSWNGLAIAGLAAAARALQRDDLLVSARRAADFLRRNCWRDGRLLAVHKDGRSRFPAYLDDYAFLAWGLLELARLDWDSMRFGWLIEIVDTLLDRFEDRENGGFFFTADDHEPLILRPKTFADDATPSGNGVAARLLVRLGFLLAEPRYLASAERTLQAARAVLEKFPHGHATLLMALDELVSPPSVVVLRGSPAEVEHWRSELDLAYDPRRLIVGIPAGATGLPAALADKSSRERTVAYLCRGMQCSAPLDTLGALARELREADQ
jgi:uncharacterized protein YyaL (SSP411 family)